jgi:hypothetical protein
MTKEQQLAKSLRTCLDHIEKANLKNIAGTGGGAALGGAIGGPLGAGIGAVAGNELTKEDSPAEQGMKAAQRDNLRSKSNRIARSNPGKAGELAAQADNVEKDGLLNIAGTAGGALLGNAIAPGLGTAIGAVGGNMLTAGKSLNKSFTQKADLKNIAGTGGGAALGGAIGGPLGAGIGAVAGNELTKPKAPKPTTQAAPAASSGSSEPENTMGGDIGLLSLEYLTRKCNAQLQLKKAITLIEGYSPMGYTDLLKAFGTTESIPDVMKEEISRPPTSWFEFAVKKSQSVDSNPTNYAVNFWYKTDLSKAVAEPLGSKFQPKERKPVFDDGGTSELSNRPTDTHVEDLAGNGKSKTTKTF